MLEYRGHFPIVFFIGIWVAAIQTQYHLETVCSVVVNRQPAQRGYCPPSSPELKLSSSHDFPQGVPHYHPRKALLP
jgi:hypothetical protein